MSFVSGTHYISGNKSQDENSLLSTNFCYFSDIFYNENGAGICFIGQGKENVNRVCSMNCSCGGNRGHFLYTSVNESENADNFVSFSSFTLCTTINIGMYACELTNGNAQMTYINISQCKGSNSGFRIVNQTNLSKTSFSNFENVTANSWMFVFNTCLKSGLIANCNFLGNDGDYFLCSEFGDLIIKECNIIQNKVTYLLLCNNASLTIIHCYIKDNSVTTTTTFMISYYYNLNSMNNYNSIRNFDNMIFDSCSAIQHMISKGLCSNEDINICKINIIPSTLPIIENYVSQ